MTDKQRAFIDKLRAQNNLTPPMLAWYIRQNFGGGDLDDLTVREASQLIEQMKLWTGSPVEVQRAFGQTVLPGVTL